MVILGYITLGLSIIITLGYCFSLRRKAQNEQATEKALELQGFLMTASIVLVFLVPLSPFHLIWMIPVSFILGLLSVTTPLKFLWIFSSIYFSFWYIGINNSGRKFYLNGDYEKAIQAFKMEINKKPSSAEAYFYLALAYGKVGERDNEISAYEKSIQLAPNNPETYFNLGGAYLDNRDKQKAVEVLKKAISLRPDYLKAHYTLSLAYAEIGDNANALKELEIVRKVDGQSAEQLASIIKTG